MRALTRNGFEIVPVTLPIADLAARLRAKSRGKLPDALIVAIAINKGADLIYSQDKAIQRFGEGVKISNRIAHSFSPKIKKAKKAKIGQLKRFGHLPNIMVKLLKVRKSNKYDLML